MFIQADPRNGILGVQRTRQCLPFPGLGSYYGQQPLPTNPGTVTVSEAFGQSSLLPFISPELQSMYPISDQNFDCVFNRLGQAVHASELFISQQQCAKSNMAE